MMRDHSAFAELDTLAAGMALSIISALEGFVS